jgi:N-dimethylarginine dimethylaminohydrolase
MYNVQSSYKRLRKVLMHRPGTEIELISKSNAHRFNYSSPVNTKLCRSDYDIFLKKLRENGTEPILVTDVLKNDKEAINYISRRPNMVYTRDIAVVAGKGMILLNMLFKGRKFDELIIEKAAKKLGLPILGRIESPGLVEGGGVMFFDEHTVLASLCDRANEQGLKQLREILFTKTPVDRFIMTIPPEGRIHIDGEFMLIDEKLALISRPDFELYPSMLFNKRQAPKPIWFMDFLESNKVELIEISQQEHDNLGANYIATRPREVVGYNLNPRVDKEIAKHGGKVSTFPARELVKGRGGPHCMTCPLWRE